MMDAKQLNDKFRELGPLVFGIILVTSANAFALTDDEIVGAWEAQMSPDVYVAANFTRSHSATFLMIRSEIFPEWEIQADTVVLRFPADERNLSTNRLVHLVKDSDGLHFLRFGLLENMPEEMEKVRLQHPPKSDFRTLEEAHGGAYYDLKNRELPPSLSGQYVEVLARLWQFDKESLATVVSLPNATPETLLWASTLISAQSQDWKERPLVLSIAGNAHTPPPILDRIWQEWEVPLFRRAIAYNPATSNAYIAAYTNMVLSGPPRIRASAAEDPSLPVDLMTLLAEDKDRYVASRLAFNKSCPAEIVAMLTKHPDDSVRQAVATHPNLTPEMKAQLDVTNQNAARQKALDRALMEAASAGNASNVADLLSQGANPNYIEPIPAYGGGDSPLFVATKAGSIDCVRILVAQGADPMQRPESDPWKFALAATSFLDQTFHPDLFDVLLSGVQQLPGADDGILDWVVCPAVRRGDTNTLLKLEQLGVNLGAISASGNAVISAAMEKGRYAEAQAWLERFIPQLAEATNRPIRVDEALEFVAAHQWQDEEFAALLGIIAGSGLATLPNDRWNAPLWSRAAAYRLPASAAALGGPPEEVAKIVPRSSEELMVAASKDPASLPLFTNLAERVLNDSTNRAQTASRLFLSLTGDFFGGPQKAALDYFLSQGADVNVEGATARATTCTPLQSVLLAGNLDLAAWLLERGADINHINLQPKSTALEFAVMQGKEDVVQWAFAHGARVQEKETGRSLLLPALARRETEALIPLLLEKGADPYVGMDSKRSAVDWLAERHDIMRLRTLDTRNVYKKLVKEYTPPKNSPFVGIWSNNKIEFNSFSLTLTPDGQALIGTSVMPLGFFPWKTTRPDQIVIEITMEKQREDWTVEWIAKSNAVRLVRSASDKSDLLFKQTEKPLTAADYIQKFKGGQ